MKIGKDKEEEVEVKGGDEQEVVRVEAMGRERQRWDAEQNQGKESDDGFDDESDRLPTPPPPPTRRHSAAT